MVRLINQHDMDAAQSLSEAELTRLRSQIADLINQALHAHDKVKGGSNGNGQHEQQQADNALMRLFGVLHSDIPKASDEEVSASIAKHIARKNPRHGG